MSLLLLVCVSFSKLWYLFFFNKWQMKKKLISCLENTAPLHGWVSSEGERMEAVWTVYLPNVVITSVRPPFGNLWLLNHRRQQ